MAFACLFLNDQQLPAFIEELMFDAIQNGILEGMLLAGLTKDGVELLQSYVDRVGSGILDYVLENDKVKGEERCK